jgi:hypothetical protein
MKAFTLHDVFKIARFTDAPCIMKKSAHLRAHVQLNRLYTYLRKRQLCRAVISIKELSL